MPACLDEVDDVDLLFQAVKCLVVTSLLEFASLEPVGALEATAETHSKFGS
jgi:hypothetical protein